MDQIRLNKLLNFYISTDQKKNFLTTYEHFQFLLTYEDRKEYQKKIANYQQEGEEIKKIILKNFIDKPIKTIFKEIGLAIANEKKNKSKNEIWNIFLERKVYFEKEFQFKLPNKYGTFEIQYYSILNDLWFYFDPEYNNAKKIKLFELLKVFRLLGYVYEDLDKKTDQEAINIFNYLVNILYIYKDSGLIELSIFHLIIYSCLSFDKDSANNRLKHIKEKYNYINYTMYINEIEAIYYDKQITGEETIKILGSNKKSIEIKAEYINWRVNEFDSLFDSENFMLCFRFPYNSDIKYIKMNETFSQGYDELFYKVIKSQVVKQAMMFDDEARIFKF